MAGYPETFRIGDYTLDARERRLLRDGVEVTLRPKAFETLLHLVGRHGHTVGKNELLEAVWPGTFVSDAVLTHCVAEVRQALGDSVRSPRYVRTLPKVGYIFVGPVERLGGGATPERTSRPFLRSVPDTPLSSAVAVLPFANLSADPENEYFCDGLSEELINGLTKVPGLQVAAHSSSFSFKGRDTDVREIGRRLGVGSVLEGSVRRTGDRLRISAQLIDAAGGFHVWCEQYDRTLSDIFALQDDISRAVLTALKVQLLTTPRHPVIRPSTRSMEAYLLYLEGRSFWHRRFAGQLRKAMECFEKAIQLDPAFAPAHAGLADSFASLGVWAFVPSQDSLPRALALARRAVELDPLLADGHASTGLLHMFYDWDWAAAERELARAIELNAGSALTHLWAAHYLSCVGRFEEAIAEVLHAQTLDPMSPITGANVGWTYHLAGRQDRAIETLESVIGRFPDNPMVLLYLGLAYAEVGRFQDAARRLGAACRESGGVPWAAESLGMVHALAGNRELAGQALDASLSRMKSSYIPSSGIACIHLGLGDDEAMFEWLDRCVEERDAVLPWLKVMPAFHRVRSRPRFQALLGRIGLA